MAPRVSAELRGGAMAAAMKFIDDREPWKPGATGSIGENTLRVIASHPDKL